MMRRLIVLLIILFAGVHLQAQHYNGGLGLRLGEPAGLTYKHISGSSAIEIIGAATLFRNYNAWHITGLYEIYANVGGVPNLSWFYGVGAHLGAYNHNFNNNDGSRLNLGPDGILGIEYTIPEIPFALSLDIKPAINIFTPFNLYVDGALTVRFVW